MKDENYIIETKIVNCTTFQPSKGVVVSHRKHTIVTCISCKQIDSGQFVNPKLHIHNHAAFASAAPTFASPEQQPPP